MRRSSELLTRQQAAKHRRQVWSLKERVLAIDRGAALVEGLDRLEGRRHYLAHLPNMIACEDEVLGVHVAGVDEPAGLLRTSTGVRWVYEPALAVHEAVKVSACAGQTLAEVVSTDLQELSANGVAHSEDLAEDVCEALLAIEAEQHSRGARDHRLDDEQAGIRRPARSVRQVVIGSRVEILGEGLEGEPLPFDPPALHVQYVVDDDPIEPSAEAAPILEGR